MPQPSQLRVAFVAPFGTRKKTTVWARTLPLAKTVVARGGEAVIIIPPWDWPEDSGKRWTDGGVDGVNVKLDGGVPGVTARMLAEVRRVRPQIVHIVKPRAYAGIVHWLLWQWRRLRGRQRPRLVLDVDDWERAWGPVARYAPPLSLFLDWQERWGITHADGITAASGWLVHKAAELAPTTPSLYLPNGVTPPPATEQPTPFDVHRPPTVLFFSRFVEVQPRWLAAFWQAARELQPDLHLIIAGKALQSRQEEAFRGALAASIGGVTWLGFVPPQRLADLFRRVDCAIFPAADAPINQSKCSVRLATTLLYGVPVVASAVGEQAHYGAKGAARLVAAEASPAQFAQEVAKVLAAPEEQRRLARNARQRLLARYNWDRLGADLVAFYRQLLG